MNEIVAQAEASGRQNPEVLAELERLQTHKPGWGNTLWILLISIVAFVIAGAARWEWKFTLWLIPVLLFHEAGHWVAMRLFRYRNLKMFFIPFFGAAVIGRHWNVPGWKKGIVSLAGPLPGIVVGSVLAVVALIVRTPWLNELAFLLLILNGFNLLPVLPLDGGHVLHVTLFCRNRWLDIAFRCAAAGGLILLGLFGVGRFLMFIGIALGLGLPLAFKQAKVVDQIRSMPLPPPLPEQDRIPAETAQAIIGALKTEQPKGTSNKMLAQQTLAVYETLNAKPPGALATLGLLAVHGGAFFASLLFCFVLMMGKFGGGFGNMLSAASRQPQHEVECGRPAETWRGSAAGTVTNRNLLVSTLNRRSEAVAAYSNLMTRLPATASLTLFGDSLLLSLPTGDEAARERWFDSLQMHSTNTFVVPSNRPVTMSLFLLAPDEAMASNLVQELQAYSAVPGLPLIPPWSATANSPTYSNYLRARLTWLRLDQIGAGNWTNAAVRDLSRRLADADQRGATNEAEQLSIDLEQLTKELQSKEREQIRTELAGTPDAALVDLHAQLATAHTNRGERKALLRQAGTLLGQATAHQGHSVWAEGGDTGEASSTGLIVEAPWCSFNDPQTSLPMLQAWLCGKDCGKFKYSFHQNNFLAGLNDLMDEPKESDHAASPTGN